MVHPHRVGDAGTRRRLLRKGMESCYSQTTGPILLEGPSVRQTRDNDRRQGAPPAVVWAAGALRKCERGLECGRWPLKSSPGSLFRASARIRSIGYLRIGAPRASAEYCLSRSVVGTALTCSRPLKQYCCGEWAVHPVSSQLTNNAPTSILTNGPEDPIRATR